MATFTASSIVDQLSAVRAEAMATAQDWSEAGIFAGLAPSRGKSLLASFIIDPALANLVEAEDGYRKVVLLSEGGWLRICTLGDTQGEYGDTISLANLEPCGALEHGKPSFVGPVSGELEAMGFSQAALIYSTEGAPHFALHLI
jgi:hypothetical protein